MKIIYIILSFIFLLSQPVNAQCVQNLCSESYDLTSGVSRFLSQITGSNFIAQKVAQSLIKKEIKKNIQVGKLDVQLKSYSVRDLKAGRFKTIGIIAENAVIEGVYFSEIEAKTLCNFNYIQPIKNSSKVFFKESFPINLMAKISESDLNKTLETTEYKALIKDLNDIGIFKIVSTSTKIKANRFLYVIKFEIPFVKKQQEVVISSDLAVNNGEIILANTQLLNSKFYIDLSNLSYILNYLNPLDYSLNIIENKDTKLNIKNVSIENNLIVINGVINVPKDTTK